MATYKESVNTGREYLRDPKNKKKVVKYSLLATLVVFVIGVVVWVFWPKEG